ncbi:hypothetical protein KGP36_06190 [Patescibacteria group bacterium]|nr:hypothetical protein [Patescibacteria group bacterium]
MRKQNEAKAFLDAVTKPLVNEDDTGRNIFDRIPGPVREGLQPTQIIPHVSGYEVTQQKLPVWRITSAELMFLWPWLVPALRYTGGTDEQIRYWIEAIITNSQMALFRTEGTVGCAEALRRPLSQTPYISEVFLISNNDTADDVLIYRRIVQWGRSIGAKEFLFDAPEEIIGLISGDDAEVGQSARTILKFK